jgi:hypothetical protein
MRDDRDDPTVQRIEEAMPIEAELSLEHSVDVQQNRTGESRVLVHLQTEKPLDAKETQLLAAGLLISGLVEGLANTQPEYGDAFDLSADIALESVTNLVHFLHDKSDEMRKTCH